jgi:2-dehydropantoate 2-reductase
MDGDIVRYRLESAMTRLVPMPIGEPDGRTTPRLERIIALFRGAGFRVTTESQMDAWLHTHAAFEVPLSRAVHVAGDPGALSTDGVAVRSMVRDIRRSLATMPNPTVPGAFRLLSVLPEGLLARVFASFLRSSAAGPLRTDSAAVSGELDTLDDQLRASALGGAGRLEK